MSMRKDDWYQVRNSPKKTMEQVQRQKESSQKDKAITPIEQRRREAGFLPSRCAWESDNR